MIFNWKQFILSSGVKKAEESWQYNKSSNIKKAETLCF